MSFAGALSTYLIFNILIVIGVTGLAFFAWLVKRTERRLSARRELQLHYGLVLVVLALSLAHPLLPRNDILSSPLQIWSAQSLKQFDEKLPSLDPSGYVGFSDGRQVKVLRAHQVATVWTGLGLLVVLFAGIFIFRDLSLLLSTRRKSFLVREVGRVRIFVNESIHVPFSFWVPGHANVVLPSFLLGKPDHYRMAIAHELQHHRHRDTVWVYVLWSLKWICLWNPAIYFWNRWICEIQEFACDETLVDQRKVESQAYARCLVEVAQTAIGQKYVPVCATGLTFLIERNLLKRRIEKMLVIKSVPMGRSISIKAGVVISLGMGVAAFASKTLVQDRRVSMEQAKNMAERAQSQTAFPIVVNELVLKQLNRYIGTPEGRETMRVSLARMRNYQASISTALRKYDVPSELLAIPIIESGYQNLADRNSQGWGAGLWMFIQQTAKAYGLRVDDQVDERLDVTLLTDAAMRYLKSNFLRFGDWHLATLAYNMGENSVQTAIEKTGSKDAWNLVRQGYGNDEDYLPKVMAAVLIMKDPETLK